MLKYIQKLFYERALMKSRNIQKGSTFHIVIIVILVAAVLGLLGFVFWQNFMNKKDAQTKTSSTSVTKTSQTSSANPSAANTELTIPEWSVKGTYQNTSANLVGLTYVFERIDPTTNKTIDTTSDKAQWLILTTPTIQASNDCKDSYTGAISRYLGDPITNIGAGSDGNPDISAADAYAAMKVPNTSYEAKAHVGNYYYFLSKPQALCASENDPLVTATGYVFTATQEFMTNLKAQ
jgi:Tfp pilus assembly protein PilE